MARVEDVVDRVEDGQLLVQEFSVDNPRLWGPGHPDRYVAVTTVRCGDRVVERYSTPFGIRRAEFTHEGFFLNGERLMLQGVCMHHDLGALGAAINVSAIERQLHILREMGTNAIRTAHNPPAPELLELCDRIGSSFSTNLRIPGVSLKNRTVMRCSSTIGVRPILRP
ncbi:MAG: glycoside hydrolase family 2 TIM barrel-domain containing protein [Alistipes communis]